MRTDESFMVGRWAIEPDRDRITRGQESRTVRPQVMKLLVYLAELDGGVAKTEDLLRDLWPNKVVSDATIYNCVAELRQALDEGGSDESHIETISKVGYRLRAPVTGLSTDSGKTQLAARARHRSDARGLPSRVLLVGIAAIAVAGAVTAWMFLHGAKQAENATEHTGSSIAVLPFDNRTGDTDNAYLVNSLHEELIFNLGKIQSLLVISPGSVERYRGSETGIPNIARELGVSAVLRGDVHTNGDGLRVNVRLIDGATDRQLWSESFNAAITRVDLDALQSSITRAIVAHLAATLEPDEQDRISYQTTDNLEAYKSVRLGDQRFDRHNVEGWQQAETYYRKAVRLDPEYSVGWQRLADSIVAQQDTFQKSTEEFREAVVAANRAIELDEQNGLAWIAKARAVQLLATIERRRLPFEQLNHMYERGIDLLPGNADAARAYGVFLLEWPGQESIAIKHLEAAVRLDPFSGRNHFVLGLGYRFLSRFPDALASNQRAHELQPDNPYAIWDIGLTYFEMGQFGDALFWLTKALEFERDDVSGPLIIAHTAIDLNCLDLPDYWIERGATMAPDMPMLTSVRMSLAITRDQLDRAVELAEHVVQGVGEERPQALSIAQAFMLLRDRDIEKGRPEVAVARYKQFFPGLADTENWNWSWPVLAIDTAFAMQQAGNQDEARSLLEQVRAGAKVRLRVEPNATELHWYLMEVSLLLGDKPGAERELQRLADGGWVSWWRYFRDRKTVDAVRDSGAFAELSAAIENQIDRQRARYNLLVSEIEAEMGTAASRTAGFRQCTE